jgi:DNA-binding beta-propeller fold protein YncE
VYVADTANSRVQVFDGSGTLLGSLGSGPGDDPGQLVAPSDVCIDPDGNAYVVDNVLGRVLKFDATGSQLISFGRPETLPSGTVSWDDAKALAAPWAVACGIPGKVFIADISNWRIARYSSDGAFELDFPAEKVSVAPLVAVATTPDGRVLVSDLTNARVAIYDVDGNELGTLIDTAGAGTSAFIPWSIDVGPDGAVYVSDIRNQRLLKLAPDGTLVSEVRLADIGQGDFYVHGLAVAADGSVVVTQSNFGYDGATWPFDGAVPADRVDRVVALGPW